jgi:hypothetical protein
MRQQGQWYANTNADIQSNTILKTRQGKKIYQNKHTYKQTTRNYVVTVNHGLRNTANTVDAQLKITTIC